MHLNFIEDDFNKKLFNDWHCFDGVDIFKNLDMTDPDYKKIYSYEDYKNGDQTLTYFYVFPVCDDQEFIKTTKDLSDNFKEYVENKNVIFLLTFGYEYHYHDTDGWLPEDSGVLNFYSSLIEYMKLHDLDTDRTVYLTGNQYNTQTLKHISADSNIRIIAYDHYQCQTREQFKNSILNINDIQDRKIEKRFLYYNNRSRIKRIFLFKELKKLGILDNSIYSHRWNYNHVDEHNIKQSLTDYGFKNFDDNDVAEILYEYTHKQKGDFHTGNQRKIIPDDFKKTHMSILSETLTDTQSRFITEKIYRCLSIGHPFVVHGSCGILKHIRDSGYKTFSSFVDESYDDEPDDEKRFHMVIREIKRLNDMPLVDFEKGIRELYNVLEHNVQVFTSKNHNDIMIDVLQKIQDQI